MRGGLFPDPLYLDDVTACSADGVPLCCWDCDHSLNLCCVCLLVSSGFGDLWEPEGRDCACAIMFDSAVTNEPEVVR